MLQYTAVDSTTLELLKVNYFHIIKSLTYFEDADKELNPRTTIKITWDEVRTEIQKQVKDLM